MKVAFLDIQAVNQVYKEHLDAAYEEVMAQGYYIMGKQLQAFEKEFAAYCNTKFAIGVGSGLDALGLILEAYKLIGKLKTGDKVLVAAQTFIATILAIEHAGLEAVLLDANPDDYNFNLEALEQAISPEVKIIMPVHLYGQIAPMKSINELAKKHNLLVIEDAAQAHGAVDIDGKKAGSLGDAAAFSFYPTKNLGALGDGGAITTSNKALMEAIYSLRNYGSTRPYVFDHLGFNSRLDELQAAFLRAKLAYLDRDNKRRQAIARTYLQGITNPKLRLPNYPNEEAHVFHLFVVRVEDRDDFMNYLKSKNIECLIHYPIPPHKQDAFSKYRNLSLPITEKLHKQSLSLPISPVMSPQEVQYVIEAIQAY